MRALGLDFASRKLREWDVPEPALRSDADVRYKLLEVGICGTDRELAAFQLGQPPEGEDRLILGHEALGEVLESHDSRFLPGDLVVPSVRRRCTPPCGSCAQNRRDQCLSGTFLERGIFGEHGYFTELAIDAADDLNKVPASRAEFAVLLEPLSVAEKAVSRAVALHGGAPGSALVVGAGSIGLLVAMTLVRRGIPVSVVSVEDAGSERARLVENTGATYHHRIPASPADIVIEAAGTAEGFTTAYQYLRPAGALVVLGAKSTGKSLDLLPLITGNRSIAGSVNAGPLDFQSAVGDLEHFPDAVMRTMIARDSFSQLASCLTSPPSDTPKLVFTLS